MEISETAQGLGYLYLLVAIGAAILTIMWALLPVIIVLELRAINKSLQKLIHLELYPATHGKPPIQGSYGKAVSDEQG